MKKRIIFALPGNEKLASGLSCLADAEMGKVEFRRFPDDETYCRVGSGVRKRSVDLVCTLDHPDEKTVLLYFLARTLRMNGALHIRLIAPYLAYMRQDAIFKKGEGLTASYYAALLSSFVDEIVTVDPHLHRYRSLDEIYAVKTTVRHAHTAIADWILRHVKNPLIVGPDVESRQWVKKVSQHCNAPFIVLEKKRKGDQEVEVSVPDAEAYKELTPVLIDDIISTGETMVQTINALKNAGLPYGFCIAIHALFAGPAFETLQLTGFTIVSCNTVEHESNRIDVTPVLAGS